MLLSKPKHEIKQYANYKKKLSSYTQNPSARHQQSVTSTVNLFAPLTLPFFLCSVRSVMHKYMEKMGEVTFDKIFNQRLGECRGDFCSRAGD